MKGGPIGLHLGVMGGNVATLSNAQTLLSTFGDTQGLAIDFAGDQSMVVADQTTPANNYSDLGTVRNGALVGPGGKLAYSANSPSPKMCLQSNGNFGYGAHNYCQFSELPASWSGSSSGGQIVTNNFAAGPPLSLGAITAARVQLGVNDYTYATNASGGNVSDTITYKGYLWMKSNTGSSQNVGLRITQGAAGAFIVAIVTTAWQQFSVTYSQSAGAASINFGLDQRAGVTGVGTTCDILIWGAQINATPIGDSSYIKNTGNSVPQISLPYEYSVAAVNQGILVEEQRSNLLTFSNTFTNAAWTPTGITNLTTTTTGPDGVSGSATLLNETIANSTHRVVENLTKAASALAYTGTVFAKQGPGRTRISILIDDGTNGTYCVYDLAGGQSAVSTANGTGFVGVTSSIVALPNGWYRCIWQGTSTAAAIINMYINDDNGSGVGALGVSYVGVVNNGCYVYNAQLEQASYITSPLGGSPIITGSASVTRAGDAVTLVSTAFPSLLTNGTIYAKPIPTRIVGTTGVFSYNDGSGNNRIDYRPDGTCIISSGGVNQSSLAATALVAGTSNKFAVAAQAAGTASSTNGAAAATTGAITMPASATELQIGGLDGSLGSTLTLSGYISQIAAWPRRFTNTQLQSITNTTLITSGGSKAYQLLREVGDTNGLAIDFATDQSMYINDLVTVGNNYNSSGTVSNGALVGPGGKLAYSANSPSPKMCLQSNGNFGYGPHNITNYSQGTLTGHVANNVTATANAAIAPDGTTTATSVIQDGTSNIHRWQSSSVPTSVVGLTYTVSVRVKPVANQRYFYMNCSAFCNAQVCFDLVGGAVGAVGAGSGTIAPAGNGYYLCSVTGTATGASTSMYWQLQNSNSASDATFTGDSLSGVNIWGEQINLGSVITSYISVPSTTPQFSLPYEFNTSAVCQGILVEEARTNLLTFSNTFSNANWGATGITNKTTTITGPDGVSGSATLINEDTSNGTHKIETNSAITKAASAIAYTSTLIAKQGPGRTRVTILLNDQAGNGSWFPFDLSGGQAGTISGLGTPFTSTAISIIALPNGWYRCVAQATSNTATTLSMAIYSDNGSGNGAQSVSFVGVIGDGPYIYNASVEQSSYISSPLGGSPIFTGSATVTRAFDTITILTSSFPQVNTGPGTYYAKLASCVYPGAAAPRVIAFNPPTETPIFQQSNTITGAFNGSTADTATFGTGGFSTVGKAAMSYDLSGDIVMGGNGTATTSAHIFTFNTTMFIGSDTSNSNSSNGYIQQIATWPNKKNAQILGTITT